MRNSYDLFHWYGWKNLFRYREWEYVWCDTVTNRISRAFVAKAEKGGTK